jgi:hypothetical protein
LELQAEAAALWAAFGHLSEHGHALLGQGRCLVRLGLADDARAPLSAARTIFKRLAARPLVAESERWLAPSAGERPERSRRPGSVVGKPG